MSEYICNTEDKCGMCEAYKTAEPIVRCRDCVRYSLDDYGNTWCAYVASAVQPGDFCAWGERKEGDSRG